VKYSSQRLLGSSLKVASLCAWACLLSACDGCGNKRPFTPYAIPSGSVSMDGGTVQVAPAASNPTLDGGSFKRVFATQAPPGSRQWTLDGVPMTSAPGRVFLAGLSLQNSSDQKGKTIAALVGDGGSMAGELVLYHQGDDKRVTGPTTLASLPSWLPVGEGCNHIMGLAQVGPTTLWVDVRSKCTTPRTGPTRWLAALSIKNPNPQRLALQSAEVAPGLNLSFDADASDQDGDGVDDLLLQVQLEGGPLPLVAPGSTSVVLRFLDRTAGMSRDPTEPSKSLRAKAASLASLASNPQTAVQAFAAVQRVLLLHETLCKAVAGAIVRYADGASLDCGDAQVVMDATAAKALSQINANDLVGAFASYARLESKTKLKKDHRLSQIKKAFGNALSFKKVKVTPLTISPIDWSVTLPIAFDKDGKLLVVTDKGVVRVDPSSTKEEPAEGVTPWKAVGELVSDFRVGQLTDPCVATFLELSIESKRAGNKKLILPRLGASPPLCKANEVLPLVTLNADENGLLVLADGLPVRVSSDGASSTHVSLPLPAGRVENGSARSPDGRWLSMAGPSSVLLYGGADKSMIWQPNSYFQLKQCTVANDAKAVACMLERGVVLLTPE
jgi:hypothetical protein